MYVIICHCVDSGIHSPLKLKIEYQCGHDQSQCIDIKLWIKDLDDDILIHL
jgi:hypothetical protein